MNQAVIHHINKSVFKIIEPDPQIHPSTSSTILP
jgi:hypothetical protein